MGTREAVFGVALTGLALLAGACATQLETEARMFRHFGQAREIHTAATFGQLERAHRAAEEMLRDPSIPGIPSGAHRDTFHRAARAVGATEEATDLPERSAALALACGGCHEARGVSPVFAIGRPPEREGVKGHMVMHAWAAGMMWESLIARSDGLWRDGALALSDHPIQPEEFAPIVSDRDTAFMLSSRVGALAREGARVDRWDERADLLARMSGTCLQCHDLAGVR